MAATLDRARARALHPFHAVLLAGTIPLFLAALLSDIAYAQTYHVQWTNFASWLVAGGLLLGGITLVLALVGLRHPDRRGGRYLVYCALLLAIWILGFVNSLVHAKDAWASMPGGLVLSAVGTVLACVATWIGFSSFRTGDRAGRDSA